MKVCLITTGQPSSNPRLVKEADALVAAGLDVRVIGAHWADWATAQDPDLVRDRAWSYTGIDWRRDTEPVRFWTTRIRHAAARATLGWPGLAGWNVPASLSRVTPELTDAACAESADLYIAHNLGALPAAARAADTHRARLGFDAEDFHRGQFADGDHSSDRRGVEEAERTWLPRCDYVTAASTGIAAAYASLCAQPPVVVLNVFPLAMRPAAFRPSLGSGPLTLYWFSQTVGAGRGLEDAVRAMGMCEDGTVALHLRGDVRDGYRETLEQVASDCGVSAHRLYWHDPAPADEMARLAANYDVGLALEPGTTPNNDVAVSNKIFTYFLAGAAVTATATTGQRAIVDETPGAVALCAPGDRKGLARAWRTWIDDRDALDRARRASWDYGTTRFNWDLEQGRFLSVIHDVLAAARV